MPPHNDERPVRTWKEYIERYLPDEARQLELLEIDPVGMGEKAGRSAIEGALARLTGSAGSSAGSGLLHREPNDQTGSGAASSDAP